MSILAGIDPTTILTAPRSVQEQALEVLMELDRREAQKRFFHLFPDETHEWRGDTFHCRTAYAPHIEFLAATSQYTECAFMAGNRTGKTETGAFALSVWLTGIYPDWWPGRRFDGPIAVWAAGKTNETTRDILQAKLLGNVTWVDSEKTMDGTGVLPGNHIDKVTWRQGVADLADVVRIRHVSGEWSELGFKSYQQGRGSFEGTARHVVWLDEEPPQDVYTECLTRTATTNGLIIATFTPLDGLTDVAMSFMPDDMRPGK